MKTAKRQQPKVQTTPPPTIQGQKLGSLTPPSSPKAQRAGHRRILSDVTHSAVFGVPASKSTQLLQAAAAEASLNKSKYVLLLWARAAGGPLLYNFCYVHNCV